MSPSSSHSNVALESLETQIFEHKPLRDEADSQEVRLLIREDVQTFESDLLRFRLEHRHLNEKHLEYNALSYTWHPERESRHILINDGLYLVPSNLHLFLERFVKEESVYIWIDQISIDQTNTLERNHQVQMMSEISSRATQVIIWLGSENAEGQADDQMAAQILKGGEHMWHALLTQSQTHAQIERDAPTFGQNREFTMADQLIIDHDPAMTEFVELKEIPVFLNEIPGNRKVRRGIAAIYKFFRKRYWSRLWVVQEILLASRVVIWTTTDLIPCFDLVSFDGYDRQLREDKALGDAVPLALLGRAPNILTQMGPDGAEKAAKDVGLLERLVMYSFFDCADPRDKIFGLQGIVRVDERMLVDYSKFAEEVFIDAVVHIALLIDPDSDSDLPLVPDLDGRAGKGLTFLVPYLRRNMLDSWESRLQYTHSGLEIKLNERNRAAQVRAVCVGAAQLREPVPRGECFMMTAWLRFMLTDVLMKDGKAFESWGAQCSAGVSPPLSNSLWEAIAQIYLEQTPAEKRKHLTRDDWMRWASSRQRPNYASDVLLSL